MTSQSLLQEVIQELQSGIGSVRCNDMAGMLERLGFEIRDGKKAGHKLFFHQGIESFKSASYTCGHGRNPEIKRPYVRQVIKILKQYEAELTEHLEGTS